MNSTSTTRSEKPKVDKPNHVPNELVREIDFYNLGGEDADIHSIWLDIQKQNPVGIVWTPFNGGHWILLKAEYVKQMYENYKDFSNETIFIPKVERESGEGLIPLEADPPESIAYRQIIAPPFMPPKMPDFDGTIRGTTRRLIDELKPRGSCEYVKEFARILPIEVFLSLMGLPLEDRKMLIPLAEMSTKPKTPEEREYSHSEIKKYLQPWIDHRRENPADDLISLLATATVDGRPIENSKALRMATLVLIGGLDTVANMLTWITHFLATSPDHREQLVDNPDLIPNALEELVRRFPVNAEGREVSRDFNFHGYDLRKGDLVLGPVYCYGLDEGVSPDPMKVDFNREHIHHITFGRGPHVCLGQHLARLEMKIFLEEWLKDIPDFELAPDFVFTTESGIVSGLTHLDLVW